MKIYEFTDYKAYLSELWRSFPKSGRGQAQKLAVHLGVNPVVISQVLKGDRHFSLEQALQIAQYYGLDAKATDYLHLLVSKERAGTFQLSQYYKQKIDEIRLAEQVVHAPAPVPNQITEFEKARFYSNWFYSGVRLLSSIEGYDSVEDFADYFKLSRGKVREIVNFLLETKLCVEEGGKIKMGPAITFVSPDSIFANSHRRNWRLKSMEKMTEPGPSDLFFTGVLSLSAEDIQIIRKELLASIERVTKRVADSPSEKLACLTVDFFGF